MMRKRRRPWAGAAAVLMAGAIGVGAAPALGADGTLEVHKGGYRDVAVTTNSPDGYAKPLAGATMEYATTATFAAPLAFPSLTNAAGLTSASVAERTDPNGYWVREKTAPAGWQPIPTLEWGGSTKDYESSRTPVTGGGTSLASATSDSVRFVNAKVNPTIQTTCRTGLNVLMVLDTSGSTSGFEADYAAAGKAFVNQLAGTNTTLKIGHFATNSTPGSTPYDLSTPAGQTSAKATIDSIEAAGGSGFTNWDAAMQDAAKAKVDVVVFITDGNPTVRVGVTNTATSLLANVTYGIASANLAKNPDMADGTGDEQAILAVGVGTGIAVNNLKAISGTVAGKDYAVASNPSDLAALLKQLATTICPTDLAIAKTGPATVAPGGTVNYDIKVTNAGSGTIPFASIKVTDPAATTLTPPAAAALPPNGSLTWTATKTAGMTCAAEVSNTATVELVNLPGYNEPDLTNNTSTWKSIITCPVSMSITKSGDATVLAGGTIGYTIDVKNTGPSPIPFASIDVTDPGASLTGPADTSALAPGATRTWTATRTAPASAKDCGTTVTNTANVGLKSTSGYTNPGGAQSSSFDTVVNCPVSFTVTKDGDPTVLPGGTIAYSIVVTNSGAFPIPTKAIVVDDPIGAPVTAPDPMPEFLAPKDSLTWTASHAVDLNEKLCNTSVLNTATVSLDTITGYVNPGGARSAEFMTQITCPLQVGISKTSTNGPVAPGGIATYDVTVTNTGAWTVPFDAILVTDNGATLTPPQNTDPLAAGDSRVWTATKDVPADTPCDIGTISNTADVSLVPTQVPTALTASIAVDPNNSSTATTDIACPVDVGITKATGSGTVLPGGTVPYTITVSNTGAFPVPVEAITVTDDGATVIGPVDPPAFLAPNASLTWTATKVAADGAVACGTSVANTAQVTLVGLPAGYTAVTPTGAASTAPPVTIGGGICDQPIIAQGQASAAARPTLSVRKVGPATVQRGRGVTYRIRVTNTSAVTATDVVITDTPPAAMRLLGTSPGATRSGRTLTWTIGDLAPGASRSVSVMVGIRAALGRRVCNVASAAAGNADQASGQACTRVQAARRVVVTG